MACGGEDDDGVDSDLCNQFKDLGLNKCESLTDCFDS